MKTQVDSRIKGLVVAVSSGSLSRASFFAAVERMGLDSRRVCLFGMASVVAFGLLAGGSWHYYAASSFAEMSVEKLAEIF